MLNCIILFSHGVTSKRQTDYPRRDTELGMLGYFSRTQKGINIANEIKEISVFEAITN